MRSYSSALERVSPGRGEPLIKRRRTGVVTITRSNHWCVKISLFVQSSLRIKQVHFPELCLLYYLASQCLTHSNLHLPFYSTAAASSSSSSIFCGWRTMQGMGEARRASTLVYILVVVLSLVAFGFAVAAERRRSVVRLFSSLSLRSTFLANAFLLRRISLMSFSAPQMRIAL